MRSNVRHNVNAAAAWVKSATQTVDNIKSSETQRVTNVTLIIMYHRVLS